MFKSKIKILLAFIFLNIFLISNNISTTKAEGTGSEQITINVTVLPQASKSGQQSSYKFNVTSTDSLYDFENKLRNYGAINELPVEFISNGRMLTHPLSFAYQDIQNNDSITVLLKSKDKIEPFSPDMFVLNLQKLGSEVYSKKVI